jgi:hypothetical protein
MSFIVLLLVQIDDRVATCRDKGGVKAGLGATDFFSGAP